MTPNPRALIIPTLLVIPRFSPSTAFLSSSACYYCLLRTFLPCPPLLHLFLDRLTASSRLALHHLRQPSARATSSLSPPKPASLECAVRHMGSGIRNLPYYLAPPMTWASI